jgi:hypothetical protein
MSALPMPKAVVVNNGVYSDEQIDHYGERFIKNNIALLGVTLFQYLADPQRYDNIAKARDSRPLLGRQLRVQKRVLDDELAGRVELVEQDVADLPRRNGTVVQPMLHFKKKRNARVINHKVKL